MPRSLSFALTVGAAATLPARSAAWWATGHLAVAAVAQARLSPAAARAAAALLALDATSYPLESALPAAADWMDLVKGATDAFSTWHYVDAPLVAALNGSVALDASRWSAGASAALVTGGGAAPNLVWALTRCFSALAPGSPAGPSTRALFLRFALHLLGDLHQPCHCAALALPDGALDAGGNRVALVPPPVVGASSAGRPTTASNLHAFWDSAGGALAAIPADYPPTLPGGTGVSPRELSAFVESLAPEVAAATAKLAAAPPLTIAALTDRAGALARAWHAEGATVAAAAVYGAPPLAEALTAARARGGAAAVNTSYPGWASYATRAATVARAQMALGGVRLAAVLNVLLSDEDAATATAMPPQSGGCASPRPQAGLLVAAILGWLAAAAAAAAAARLALADRPGEVQPGAAQLLLLPMPTGGS